MNACEVCAYADKHGWWGPVLDHPKKTHCRDCHLTYWGHGNLSHCAGCHHTFSSLAAFDYHQTADGCLDPATRRRENGQPSLILEDGIWYRTDKDGRKYGPRASYVPLSERSTGF